MAGTSVMQREVMLRQLCVPRVQNYLLILAPKSLGLRFRVRFRWDLIFPFGVCDPELPRGSAPDLRLS